MSYVSQALSFCTLTLVCGFLAGCPMTTEAPAKMTPSPPGDSGGNGNTNGTVNDVNTGETGGTSGSGSLHVLNGIADSTSISAVVSGTSAGSSNIQVDSVGPLATVAAGTYSAQIQPNSGSGYTINGVPIDDKTLTTVITDGVLANSTQTGFVATESLAAPATGQVVVQPVFAAYTAAQGGQSQNFTFTFHSLSNSSQADVSENTLFGQSPAPLTLPAGQYRIEVLITPNCPANETCPAYIGVTFDSGSQTGVTLPAAGGSNVVQLVAVDATKAQASQYSSSVILLLLDSAGSVTPIY